MSAVERAFPVGTLLDVFVMIVVISLIVFNATKFNSLVSTFGSVLSGTIKSVRP